MKLVISDTNSFFVPEEVSRYISDCGGCALIPCNELSRRADPVLVKAVEELSSKGLCPGLHVEEYDDTKEVFFGIEREDSERLITRPFVSRKAVREDLGEYADDTLSFLEERGAYILDERNPDRYYLERCEPAYHSRLMSLVTQDLENLCPDVTASSAFDAVFFTTKAGTGMCFMNDVDSFCFMIRSGGDYVRTDSLSLSVLKDMNDPDIFRVQTAVRKDYEEAEKEIDSSIFDTPSCSESLKDLPEKENPTLDDLIEEACSFLPSERPSRGSEDDFVI